MPRRRFGDRKDGRLLRTLSPFYRTIPFIMVTREDATNLYESRVETTAGDEVLRRLRSEENLKGIGMLHAFVAAYVRTVALFPQLNRFISGQRIYARNKIEVSMVVKRKMSADAGETSIKIAFEPTDTLREVYLKMNGAIDKIKNGGDNNNTEDTAVALAKIPRLLLKFTMWALRALDYFGKMPQSIIDASLFHSSLVVSDLGSTGIGKIYHHLYNFGNLPVFIAFGQKYRVWELDKNGASVERHYIDYGVDTDERICDGFTYALCFRHMNRFLHHPELLLEPPAEVNKDID